VTKTEVEAIVDAWGNGTWSPFSVGDQVEMSVACVTAPCPNPQGTVIDATVRVHEDPAIVGTSTSAFLAEGEVLREAETVYTVKVRDNASGHEGWYDITGLKKLAPTVFAVGDRVEISVVCFMPPCPQPQGTVIDANVRIEDRPALYQGPDAAIRVVPEGEPYQPARTVRLVKIREDDGQERWRDVCGLKRLGPGRVVTFSGEENVSPWGWLAVGGVIAGVMGAMAWLGSKAVKHADLFYAVDTSHVGVFDVPVEELPDDVKAYYEDRKKEIWGTELKPSGPGWSEELRVHTIHTNVHGQEYVSWDGWERTPGKPNTWRLR